MIRRTTLTAFILAVGLAGPVVADPNEPAVEIPLDPSTQDERCRWETFPGSWRSTRTGNVWTFAADGALSCDGPCSFIKATGQPISWDYEPGADLFARPITHVKMAFEHAVFQGVFGAFRCRIQNDGMTLMLEPEDDEPMIFHRYEVHND